MAPRPFATATVVITALLAGGCSVMSFGRDEPDYNSPAPLAAAPTDPVTTSTLPPPPGSPAAVPPASGGLAALDPSMQGQPGTTATVPATGTVELGRTDMLGGWTIAAAGESCQLFMTLTTWSGGYRASTRGCVSPGLQTVSAWNLETGQVQLFNDAGSTVARLYPSSRTQFSGQIEGGAPITVSR